jgi:hypothetical protein
VQAQPQQEPVAWVVQYAHQHKEIDFYETDIKDLPVGTKLYTSPPQRPWVGLTPKDVADLVVYPMNPTADLVKAVEAKLKEKNNAT